MDSPIPDLWAERIRADVLPPAVILRAQESFLTKRTQGILEAKVFTVANESQLQHHLDLIAPALEHYRITLLTANHKREMVYPVTVTSEAFVKGSQSVVTAVKAEVNSPPANQRQATTQEEFIQLVREALHSNEVVGMMQSLIARSNEGRIAGQPSQMETMVEDSVPPGASSGEAGSTE